jgi:signal transduction histidine kinase
MTPGRPASPAAADLESFAARAAHQLGEAVALIRGSTTVLESQGGRLGPAGGDALRGMTAGVDRAQRYVDDMLDLSGAASAELRPAPVDLDTALDDAEQQLAPALQRGRATVRRGALGRPELDPRQAERLLVHLLRIALAAGARTIAVAAEPAGDGVAITVADDGTPPPDVEAAGLLEPLAAPRGRGPLVGAGVSFAVCRRIAERHDGDLAIEVRDGATVVTVTVPGGA